MKYTLVFDNKFPATKLIDGLVLGKFNNYQSIAYTKLSYIRTRLKSKGIKGIYTYSENNIKDKRFKIKSINEIYK